MTGDRINPIDRLSMPVEAMRDLVRGVPDRLVADIRRDNQGPSGPCSMIPADLTTAERPRPQSTPGWVPLSNPPGVPIIDQLCDAADAADRLPNQQAQVMQAMQMAMQVLTSQTQMIAKLFLEERGADKP